MKLALVASLVLLAPFAAGLVNVNQRVYEGPITHDLVAFSGNEVTIYTAMYGEPHCHGEGVGVVHVDLDNKRGEIVNPDSNCVPGFTTLTQGCALVAPDQHVHCARNVGDVHINLDIALDGTLVFTYDDPAFFELITGQMTRVV